MLKQVEALEIGKYHRDLCMRSLVELKPAAMSSTYVGELRDPNAGDILSAKAADEGNAIATYPNIVRGAKPHLSKKGVVKRGLGHFASSLGW
jgi:hypothetical protein